MSAFHNGQQKLGGIVLEIQMELTHVRSLFHGLTIDLESFPISLLCPFIQFLVQPILFRGGTRQFVLRLTGKQAELPPLETLLERQVVKGSDFPRLLSRALKIKEPR